jgi:hypothetical protein
MAKKSILLVALAGVLLATGTAFALTGTRGLADRIAVREGYSQYEGKVDLRDSSGAVIFYYWGGDRCAGMPGPTNREVDLLLDAHLHGHDVSFDYADHASAYGTSRCWDGGLQVW